MYHKLLALFKRDKYILLTLAVYYAFIVCITPMTSHYDLIGFFIPWINAMLDKGIHNIYENPLINYPPITLYVMYLFGLSVQLFDAQVASTIYYLKTVVFLFDVASFYIIFKIMQRFNLPHALGILFLANLALIYNTVFWGQVDIIYTFFVLLSVYLALTKRPLWSLVALICAVFAKPQALVFIPAILLLLLPYFYRNKSLFIKAPLIIVVTSVFIFLPYLTNGTIGDYITVLQKTTDYYPKLSMYAFNFWTLKFGVEESSKMSDVLGLFGISYRLWGIGMFGVWSLIVLYPLFSVVKSQLKHNRNLTGVDWQIVFLSLSLLALVFFFFNTQMHERYAHAAVMFSCIYALLSRKYIMYGVMSLAYIANLTDVHSALSINPSEIISPTLAALLYGAAVIYGAIELYSILNSHKAQLKIAHIHPAKP